MDRLTLGEEGELPVRIAAAIRGHLVNGLITDEATAQALLNQE